VANATIVVGLVALVGLIIASAACSNRSLSRDKAEQMIRSRLESENTVYEVRVRGIALQQLLEAGHLALSQNERWCGISECADVQVSSTGRELFSDAKGAFYKRMPRDNAAVLTLAQPIAPRNLNITGIVSDGQNVTAVVEFVYSYDPPPAIAQLDVTSQGDSFMGMGKVSVSGIEMSRNGIVVAGLLGPHNARWTFQRYDDGWRLVR